MKITDITRQKKTKKRLNIFCDGKFTFGIDEEIFFGEGFCLDSEISQKDMELLLEKENFKYCYNRAILLLSNRAHHSNELKQKLYRKNFDSKIIEKVIRFLFKENYLDDKMFMEDFLEELILKQFGRYKILSKFLQRGIDSCEAKNIINSNYSHQKEVENAKSIISDKNLKQQYDINRILKNRGFDFKVINEIIFDN